MSAVIRYEKGHKFGSITFIEDYEFLKTKSGTVRVSTFKCECGNLFNAKMKAVKNGNTKSCGCRFKKMMEDRNTIHGLSGTRIYKTWKDMKARCYNQNNKDYKNYNGRGISVCEAWRNDFKSFHDWAMSNNYSDNLTIDRIDNDGNYEPSNCRWVDRSTQSQNRRYAKNKTDHRNIHKVGNGFVVKISHKAVRHYLGYFNNINDAILARNNFIDTNCTSHKKD